MTFALGLVLGCTLMLGFLGYPVRPTQPITIEETFTIERAKHTETYAGKALQELYPYIENPTMIVERTQGATPPRRVVQGTLDNGKIHILWNLR